MSTEITKMMEDKLQKIKDDIQELDGCDTFDDALSEVEHLDRTVSSLKKLIKASINARNTGNPLIKAPHICGVYGYPDSMIWIENGRVINGAWDVMIPVEGDGSVVYSPFDEKLENPIPYLFSTIDILDTPLDGYVNDISNDYNAFLNKARDLFDKGLIAKKSPGDRPLGAKIIPDVEIYDDHDESIDDIPF